MIPLQKDPAGIGPDKETPPADPSKGFGEIVTLLLQEGYVTEKQARYAHRVRSKLDTSAHLLGVMKELQYVTDEEIREVLQKNLGTIRTGDLLVELGHISDADLQASLAIQKREKPRKKLGEILVDHNFINEQTLLEILSWQLGFPVVEPEFGEIDEELARRGRVELYVSRGFLPLRREGGAVVVAFADPTDSRDVAAAKNIFGHDIVITIATQNAIIRGIKRIRPDAKTALSVGEDDSSVVEIVDSIILAAIEESASDIHVEPMHDRIRVRFRQDGVLVHHKDFPLEIIPSLTSRMKIMCQADIAEKRRHQGGRILFEHKGGELDLRVSFYVTVHGEKIVLRLLNRQNQLFDLKEIGMSRRMLERFKEDAIDRPSGVVIITGPTGSGKTTTVYSSINYLNDPQTSIITAEEPVEYVIPGISQCSIDPKINLTFDETLRHIVRQDPDIVVIGEIRDTYSAGVAVQAALTGHKVLTTFHTEDSIGGLVRLLNMEIDAFLISSTVVCVVAQRLLRRVCTSCEMPHQLSPVELRRLHYGPQDVLGAEFRKGRGCPHCRYSGYKGRVAIFEMLILEEPVRDAILARKTSHQIRSISIESTGLVTLLEDGIVKAAAGITTIEEVLRCLPRLQKPRPLPKLQHLLGAS
ncbi:MAG: GspE/PulE family protein [Thermodesulfobacteriota bacterium]|nr:GspE/PulE family protein [Thermodesulfobacteriota bacterium]